MIQKEKIENRCSWCAKACNLYYTNEKEQTNFKFVEDYIWCKKFKEVKECNDLCVEFSTDLPF